MTEPLVTAEIITYNHAPYIAQAIQGVLQQKVTFPFELVIGEDCSTDGTREIVFEYQQKYPDTIRVVTSDENVGGRRNGRRTLKACRGEYIAFCEGDDYWHNPTKLQKQVDYMESHPECGLVFGDYDVYYQKFDRLVRSYNCGIGFKSVANLTIEQILEQRWRPSTCTALVRKSLIAQVIARDPYLHEDGKFLMGDTQLWAELAAISTVSYIPESLGTYRILEESASSSRDAIKTARFGKSAYEMKLYLCDKHSLSNNLRREFELAWCDNSLRLALYSRNPQLAEEVRRKKRTFTCKDWIRYCGAKHMPLYYFCRFMALIRSPFRKALP